MGGLFSSPKTPSIPAVPPLAAPATMANQSINQAGAALRMRAAAAGASQSGTLMNTAQGLSAPATTQRTLLGG